ncbi:MAG: gluconate 2-dehydrogenase subunit 3 family protein [Myxococcota bacterium]
MSPTPPETGHYPPTISRRGFLKRTAAASVFLFAVRVGPSRAATPSRGAHAPQNLDAGAYATLEAFCDRLIRPAPGAPTAAQSRVALRIDHEIGVQGEAFARDMRDGLAVVAYSGLLEGKFKSFRKLAAADRDAVLRGMMRSRFAWRRASFQGLKQLVMFYYYADDRAWPSTGYDGPWVKVRTIAASDRNFPFPTLEGGA